MAPSKSTKTRASRGTPKRRPKGAGRVRQLPSGRWQARYPAPADSPDAGRLITAPHTFDTKMDAAAWLAAQADDEARGLWTAPDPVAGRRQTLRTYSVRWLAERDLGPRTRADYRSLLDNYVLPDLGDLPLDRIKPATVRTWFARVADGKPTTRAKAYSLLRTIMASAADDDFVGANPVHIRGGGQTKRKHDPRPATLEELRIITENVPERYQLMVLLAAWLQLRFGELTELRRKDVDTACGEVRIRRAVTRANGEYVVGDPKTRAGLRTVTIPPHLRTAVAKHLAAHVANSPDALLFPARHGGHMAPSTLNKVFNPAREVAGRSDLRFHDLRHTGAVLAAAAGATLADLMARLGHTTPQAAMIYQHSAAGRDAAIAAALSDLATSAQTGVLPLRPMNAASA